MMLTKTIVKKQEHIGLACQTGQTQTRAKSRYALDEVSIGDLQTEGRSLAPTESGVRNRYLGGPK
jgi:hypothetical protein